MWRANKKFLEFKQKLEAGNGVTYREIAKKTGMTPAAWNQPITQNEPMTVERARRFVEAFKLDDQEKDEFLTVVCAELILSFLSKMGVKDNPPTPHVATFIKVLEKAIEDPESLRGYIM